jgi:protein-S-isoprenylcysteine O-methyltransferase Ste14
MSSFSSLFIRMGNFFFHYRIALFPALVIIPALLVSPAKFLGNSRLDLVAVIAGTVIALSGQAVRCATIGLVYIKRGGWDKRIYASNLVTEGIYGHTRNPMYLGNIMVAGGICLVYGSPWTYAVIFPLFLMIYLSITQAEEDYLVNQFGDEYVAYCRDTNRFFPKMNGLGQTLARHRFEWKYVIKKEYGTMFGLSLGLYIMILVKYYRVYAPSPIPERPILLAVPIILLSALYGTARWLKKSGRI